MDVLDELLAPLADPPSAASELRDWVELQAERFARVLSATFATATERGANEYLSTLTAAGDIAAFDRIGAELARFVAEVGSEYVTGMYLAGGLSAYVHAPGAASAAVDFGLWSQMVNDLALDYQRTARNRIVNATVEQWREVRAATIEALSTGEPTEQLKAKIEELTGFSEFRADAIARTETMGAYSGGDMAGARALGDHGPVEKVWSAVGGPRTRESHALANEQVVPFEQPFIVGGYQMDRPLDPAAPASEVVNCRCVVLFLYEGDTRPDGSVVER